MKSQAIRRQITWVMDLVERYEFFKNGLRLRRGYDIYGNYYYYVYFKGSLMFKSRYEHNVYTDKISKSKSNWQNELNDLSRKARKIQLTYYNAIDKFTL